MREQGPSEQIVGQRTVVATPEGLRGLSDRHLSVKHFAPLFAYGQLPRHLQAVSAAVARTAAEVCTVLQDGPELAAGLRKLREAKDCLVTQAVIDRQTGDGA
jgi:hypothetical protein